MIYRDCNRIFVVFFITARSYVVLPSFLLILYKLGKEAGIAIEKMDLCYWSVGKSVGELVGKPVGKPVLHFLDW